MATRQEVARIMEQINAARDELDDAASAISNARDVLLDARALIDAMAELRGEA